MDPSLQFYLYGSALYLSAALVGSWYFTRSTQKKSRQRAVVELVRKRYLKTGFIGYCTYCASYLLDEDYVAKHIQGKKHRDKASGASNWLELRKPSDANEEKKPTPRPPPPPPQEESASSIADRMQKQKMQGSGPDKFEVVGRRGKPKAS
jgi:type IV secretory pathway VirB10-like protein